VDEYAMGKTLKVQHEIISGGFQSELPLQKQSIHHASSH
jgi:hypothetical protein